MNTMTHPTAPAVTCGANAEAFAHHPGYRRMFAADHLTLGIFLPLRFYQGDMAVLHAQAQHVSEIERLGFAAVWVRDVPLFDPSFGDAGQVFDPFVYLGYLAAHTRHIALVTGSAIFTLRHPIDLAKSAASLDRLSGGRLVMGIASGDRAVEFPAYGLAHDQRGERFAHSVDYFRQLLAQGPATIRSPLGQTNGTQLLPQPVTGRIPLIVTGSSRQSLQWLGEQADGWLTYPDATHTAQGPLRLAEKVRAWRSQIPTGGFRPHMTNEWIDLDEDPDFPRTPLQGGYVLKTGRNGLIALLGEWKAAGVNHAALGIQMARRPVGEVIQELAEEVLPLFPTLQGPAPLAQGW